MDVTAVTVPRSFFPLVLGACLIATLLLGTEYSLLAAPTLVLWGFFLALDFRSTWKIYRRDPDRFSEKESNEAFVFLYEKLGFKAAVPPFLLFCEVPVLLFISLYGAPIFTEALPVDPSPHACVASASTCLALAHLDAWRKNNRFVLSKKAEGGKDE